ncbi:hypothetical protein Tco_0233483 [Tanacetum coccineum]
MQHSHSNDDTCFRMDVIDKVTEKELDALLDDSEPFSTTLEKISKSYLDHEFEEFMAIKIEEIPEQEEEAEDNFEELPLEENLRIKKSIQDPPTDLMMKPLPKPYPQFPGQSLVQLVCFLLLPPKLWCSTFPTIQSFKWSTLHTRVSLNGKLTLAINVRMIAKKCVDLEYDFLEKYSLLPVVISALLKDDEKKHLVSVLNNHKEAFAWKTSDILEISPSFCKYKINFEDDAKPVIQRQRRLNPNMKEVVKK